MNYYIDFDNTVYETANLTKEMLEEIANSISEKSGKKKEELLETIKKGFDSTNDNIYSYAERVSNDYHVDSEIVVASLKNIIENGEKFVFEDAKRFLGKLKENGYKIILLTFLPKTNQEYQLQKINGSGLAKYFDTMILTTELKYTLDLNYENGIFIDDNPRDLEGLNSMNPLRLIRMRRASNKYSKTDMNVENMEEYVSFDDISLDFHQ